MDYKELYLRAWNRWALSWKNSGIDVTFAIELSVVDGGYWMMNHTYVRKQLLVHKVVGSTEEEMWEMAVNDLLSYGAAKMYESIIELRRAEFIAEANREDPASRYKYQYPLHPNGD